MSWPVRLFMAALLTLAALLALGLVGGQPWAVPASSVALLVAVLAVLVEAWTYDRDEHQEPHVPEPIVVLVDDARGFYPGGWAAIDGESYRVLAVEYDPPALHLAR